MRDASWEDFPKTAYERETYDSGQDDAVEDRGDHPRRGEVVLFSRLCSRSGQWRFWMFASSTRETRPASIKRKALASTARLRKTSERRRVEVKVAQSSVRPVPRSGGRMRPQSLSAGLLNCTACPSSPTCCLEDLFIPLSLPLLSLLIDISLSVFTSSFLSILLLAQRCLLEHRLRQTAALYLPRMRDHTIRFRDNGTRTRAIQAAASGLGHSD